MISDKSIEEYKINKQFQEMDTAKIEQKKYEDKQSNITIPEYIGKEFKEGKKEAEQNLEVIDNKYIEINQRSQDLLAKANKRQEDYGFITELQKIPLSDLTQENRDFIIKYNSPENQLTLKEEFEIDKLVKKQEEYTEKRDDILAKQSGGSLFRQIGRGGRDLAIRGTDDNLENDTIASRTMGAFIAAGESISKIEPTEIHLDAIQKFDNYLKEVRQVNTEYDETIKKLSEDGRLNNMAYVAVNVDRFKKLFIGGEYLKATGHYAEIGYEKLASGFSSDIGLSGNDRVSRIIAGVVETAMSPINATFDEKVSGKYGEAGGLLMTATFEPVMATISEVTQGMGSNRETADNWAFVVTAAVPFIKYNKRGQYLTEQTTFFNTIKDPNLQKSYIKYIDLNNKIRKIETEFKNKEYIGADKIESPREFALFKDKQVQRIISDTNIPKKEKTRILEKFLEENKTKYFELKKQKKEIWKTKTGNLFDVVATKIGAKNNLIKETLIKDTEIRLTDKIENTKIDNFIDSIVSKSSNIIMSEVANLPKQVNGKWLNSKEKKQAILQKETDIVTKQIDKLELDILPKTRKKIIENTLDIIHQKQGQINSTARELKQYQDRKRNFNEVAEELGWSKEAKTKYSKEWEIKDNAEFGAKYDGIKFLEKEGIIEYIGNDYNGNRTYKIVEGMEKAFNGMKGEIYHYPEHLYKTKEMARQMEKMEQLAKEGCL